MADTKTSDESAASALDGTELVRGVQGGSNVKITVTQIGTRTHAQHEASAANILAGTADKVVDADTLLSALAAVALSDGANIAVDLATGVYFTVTLAGNRQLDNPSNHKAGRTVYFKVTQDGTGSRTLSYDTQYDFGQDSAPALSTAAGKVDLLAFFVSTTSKLIYLGCRTDVG